MMLLLQGRKDEEQKRNEGHAEATKEESRSVPALTGRVREQRGGWARVIWA